MLLFSVSNLSLFVLGVCQRWQNPVMGGDELERQSNFQNKPAEVFNCSIGSQSHRDYHLSGDNKLPEIRTSLTLKSGWRRPIFPIPR